MSEDKNINLDQVLAEIGQWGRFQFKVVVLCALVSMMVGLQDYSYLFTLQYSRTRCLIPECENISSPDAFAPPWIQDTVPTLGDSFDNCHRFSKIHSSQNSSGCWPQNFDKNSSMQCEEFVYEHKNTAYFEFNLACDDFRPYLVGSVRMLGTMIFFPINGFVADRWGRRVALSLTAFNLAWTGILTSIADSYTSYTMLSFLEYLLGSGSYTWAYILALEYTQPKYRVVTGVTLNTCVAVGEILSGLIAWTEPYWKHLILMIYAPQLIFIIYFWIAPESIRWLLSKDRYDDALVILRKAAEMNERTLSESTLKAFTEPKNKLTKEKDTSEPWLVYQVFRHKPILLRCLITPIWCLTCSLLYFGLTISSVGISGNTYLNFMASIAVQIPGCWLPVFLMDRIGRKPLVMTGFLLSGAFQIAFIFISSRHYVLSLLIFLFGKMSISCVMSCLLVYMCEMFPTRYRASFLAYLSLTGAVGSILAPLMPGLGARTWEQLPFLIFGVMALVSGLLVLPAPETLGTKLPDTMEEAAQLGKDSSASRWLRTLVFKSKKYTIR